jgi:hypothetical protein
MSALEQLNGIISDELTLSMQQHATLQQQQAEGLATWLTANRAVMLASLDQIAALSVPSLQTKILAGDCMTIAGQKHYEISLNITDVDLIARLDDALNCPKCMKLAQLVNEYNESHPTSSLVMGGIRRVNPDETTFLVYYSTR